MKLNLWLSLSALFIFSACEKQDSHVPVPTSNIPQLISIQGGTIRIKATDPSQKIESSTVLTDQNKPISDGTKFRLVADTVKISSDNANWVSELIVNSEDGNFKFYAKPHTVAGLYRVNAYPVASENIKFDQGLNARFFINVVAGDPSTLGLIKTDYFEDLIPYNGVKNISESWILSSNPDTVSYIVVGPVSDNYGNLLEEGAINLTVDQGNIISENPTRIISGYSYFSYKSDGVISSFNTTAIIAHTSGIVLTKNESIKKSSPQLLFLDNPDFTLMSIGETRCQSVRLTNPGSMLATNLEISSTFPFSLVDESVSDPLCIVTNDTCKQHQSLRSGEVCKARIKFTQPSSSVADGELIAQMSPQEFSGSLAIQKLRTQAVQSAALVSANAFVSFGGTQCSSLRTVDIVVINTGDFDATGITVQNPPPNNNQTNPFYTIILPSVDAPMSSNPNAIINCGTTFPPNRKCRVQVKFNPTSGIVNQALIGKILGSNINPLILTVSGYTVPGQALNTFPLSFITPNNSIIPFGMYIQSSQRTRVDVGPIVDACNQVVSDGSILTASVTAGSLVESKIVTNNGQASFNWNSIFDTFKLGNQTITVSVGTGGTKTGTLLFRGIDLQLTGLTQFNQVVEGKSKTLTLTLSNNGNITATNLSFITSSPLVIIDKGDCASGILVAGLSCQIVVRADPIGLNQDMNISINASSPTPGNNAASIIMHLNARTKAILTFDKDEYLFNTGASSTSYQKVLTLTNHGPAISFNTSFVIEPPFLVQYTTCTSTLAVNSSCEINIALAAADVGSAANKTIKVANEIDTNSPSAILSFSTLKFNQDPPKAIVGRCFGPLTISVVGSLGVLTQSSNILATLNSISNSILFYSSATCTAESAITQIQINGGSVASANIYIKNLSVLENLILAQNPRNSSAYLLAQFNDEIDMLLPSPNALSPTETMGLVGSGGYPPYTYTFIDGTRTSTEADILYSGVDLNGNPDPATSSLIKVKTLSAMNAKVVRITDTLGYTKNFTINLYPPVTSSSITTVDNYDPRASIYDDYGNPNIKTFTIQHFDGVNYVNGSLYGSVVDSLGNFTAGKSISVAPVTEYVLVSVPKYTGGNLTARVTFNMSIAWPYGTLGDLVINGGQTISMTYGQIYDYKNVTINQGGILQILNPNPNADSVQITTLGVAGNLINNGTIRSAPISVPQKNSGTYAFYSFQIPNTSLSNFIILSINFYQSSGGSGMGAVRAGGGYSYYGNGGGAGGHEGYGGGSATVDQGGFGGNARPCGAMGIGGVGGTIGSPNGGQGSYGYYCYGGYGAGGGGGFRGYHAAPFALKIKGLVSGGGVMDFRGYDGGYGGGGGPGPYYGPSGGGGAGGNAGQVWIYLKNTLVYNNNANLFTNGSAYVDTSKISIICTGGNGGYPSGNGNGYYGQSGSGCNPAIINQ